MDIRGKLHAESPIYRGNSRKTLFTRDGDGTHRLVSLAGDVAGTAQSLMDAFIGQSKNGRNTGLLNQLWLRLYNSPLPDGLIRKVDCTLQQSSYPRDRFFDLRMGIKLDEDRWAAEANANYKLETVFKNSAFDLTISINDGKLKAGDNQAKLYYLLQELVAGRFWFGAGKSRGLGRLRLEMQMPFGAPATPPKLSPKANHLRLNLTFDSENPVLVGWNWGKVDPDAPSFAAVDGRVLVEALRQVPPAVRQRLAISLGGPLLNPEKWKQKFADQLPRALAIWTQEQASTSETTSWVLPAVSLKKLNKGKYSLPKKNLNRLEELVDQPFETQQAAEIAIADAMADKENMQNRVQKLLEEQTGTQRGLNDKTWHALAEMLGQDAAADSSLKQTLEANLGNENALHTDFTAACRPQLALWNQQIDQQINLLQSDSWLDMEVGDREEHLMIKQMIQVGEITERDWGDRNRPPKGINAAAWREFLESHNRVKFQHLTNGRNLQKSITNDENMIAFLKAYRTRTRQELSQPYHIDFRAGGRANREISKSHGKPYDTVFMRMLSWMPSSQEQGAWEVYIPGSTLKGAFRKRASQVLKTVWGESSKTTNLLNRLFGAQSQRGILFFSDAYLANPADPQRSWCSMDGVKMDPKTGAPVESAKRDFLYAYGEQLAFRCQIDVQDISDRDLEALALLSYLLQDFQAGDIPLGGEKTSGFGWVQAVIEQLEWLCAEQSAVTQKVFGKVALSSGQLWQQLVLKGENAVAALEPVRQFLSVSVGQQSAVPRSREGFVSHRAFGGYCGMLCVEAEALTPITIQESGQPSFTTNLADGPVNGYDFFSMSPPDAEHRPENRVYALPSKSLRGMLRHLYAIASDSAESSRNLTSLTPVDSLFGWVGQGQNQAIMGRVSTSFGYVTEPQLAWFKVPYPYGGWHFANGKWTHDPQGKSAKMTIAGRWRVFPHAPLYPEAVRLDDFRPDTAQAGYSRAILPGSKARFTVRFWNLEKEELQRLIWTVALEPELAHKIGKSRYLGFGSLRLRIVPAESYLIDWTARYAGKPEQQWQQALKPEAWHNPRVIAHYDNLRKALNAQQL